MRKLYPIFFALLLAGFSACKKEPNRLPDLQLKSGPGYISGDAVVSTGDTLRVKAIVNKTDHKLSVFYVSCAYDGVSLAQTMYTYNVTGNETEKLEKEYTIITRSTPGNERWVFRVNDTRGYTAETEILLRVQ